MRLREWMEALPRRLKLLLPPDLQGFRWSARPWLVQVYYRDPALHYEVWHLGERRGRIEVGLHFESRDPVRNRAMLMAACAHIWEIRAQLGPYVEAELWDRGWAKVFETHPLTPLDEDSLERFAQRLARWIQTLEPLLSDLPSRAAEGIARPKIRRRPENHE